MSDMIGAVGGIGGMVGGVAGLAALLKVVLDYVTKRQETRRSDRVDAREELRAIIVELRAEVDRLQHENADLRETIKALGQRIEELEANGTR